MKTELKSQAFKLRKEGKSYREIGKSLQISKGTISYWFKDINWSEDIKKQLEEKAQIVSKKRLERLINLRKIKFANLYKRAEREAIEYFSKNKENPLFIAGIMLYWGEGEKGFKNGRIKLSNTDPAMIRIFRNFLLEIFKYHSEKIKGWILLYPELDAKECLEYWAKNTGIPYNNFTKSITIQGRHKTHRLAYGVCNVHITNKYLKKKILTWLELYSKYL